MLSPVAHELLLRHVMYMSNPMPRNLCDIIPFFQSGLPERRCRAPMPLGRNAHIPAASASLPSCRQRSSPRSHAAAPPKDVIYSRAAHITHPAPQWSYPLSDTRGEARDGARRLKYVGNVTYIPLDVAVNATSRREKSSFPLRCSLKCPQLTPPPPILNSVPPGGV